nr:DivIVA domain-containing protein [Micromonospora sp. DSM 115978]
MAAVVTSDSGAAKDRPKPWQVRVVRFARRWRGLDPREVYAYLGEVADELDRLAGLAVRERVEAERLREGLRQWRQRHVGCRFNDPPFYPGASTEDSNHEHRLRNQGRW